MIFDQFRKFTDFSADVHAGRWVRDTKTIENGLDTFIGLILSRYASNLQRPGIKRLEILGGAEPRMPELNHLPPMDVHAEYDEESDEVGNNDVSIEEGAFNVTDCEHAEDVAAFSGDGAEVIDDIDWDEDGACEKGNAAK